ncbi:MAG: creatininase family protein [Clostridia bacterium]|nr:creatininase family protein [Clostridia bacterium]MBP3359595.1 creatininase family protein [Clostridia bacterium]
MYLDKCFPREIENAKKNNTPVVIVGGTVEYHGPQCSYGCDTLVAQGLIEKLSEKKEIIIAPQISYSPASYAVGDAKSGTVHVEENAFEEYVYYVFMSMLSAGLRNIYVVIHHQFEQESLMPMTLSYMKAAKRATMAYLEQTKGQGWWGSESYKDYYENLEGEDNPFGWIKVIPTMSKAVQDATGYDHAGKYECSILMALYPDAVKLERLGDIEHWFTKSSAEANTELGNKMVELSLEYLEKTIV